MQITFQHLYSSYQDKRKIEQSSVTVIKSMDEYNQLAEKVGSRKINFPGVVDFSKQSVLHINLGTKGSDEFPIVKEIAIENKSIQIQIIKDSSWDSVCSPCCTVVVDYLFTADEYLFQIDEIKLSKKDQLIQEQFWTTFSQADKLQRQLAVKFSEAMAQNTSIYTNDNTTTTTMSGVDQFQSNSEFKM